MRQQLKVIVSEISKAPYAEVSCDCMWELTEYLSFQRVIVVYDFKHTHFTVTFPRQSARSAQELLDQWAHDSEACANVH